MPDMSKTVLTKFLYFTDSQIRVKTPESRTDDNFLHVILDKLRQIFDYAIKINASAVICGGDIGDFPVWAKEAEIEFIELLSMYPEFRFFVVPGNHDMPGKHITNLKHTSLNMFNSINLLNVIASDSIKYVHGTSRNLRLSGYEYGNNKYINNDINADIMVIHDTVGIGESPYWKNIDEIDIPNCKLALFGDVHSGFELTKLKSGCVAVNPGSLTRMSLKQTHQPKFLEIVWYTDDTFDIVEHNVNCAHNPFKIKEDNTDKIIDLATKFSEVKKLFKERKSETSEEKITRIGYELSYTSKSIDKAIQELRNVR